MSLRWVIRSGAALLTRHRLAVLRVMLGGLIALAPFTAPAAESTLQPLTVSGFVTAANLPLWAGRQQGFFSDVGIDLVLESPSGSIDQMRSLIGGRCPVLLTAFDNVAAYRRGQGAPEIGAIPDFIAIAGVDNGMLTLVATAEVVDIKDLEGRTLAVDAANSGFSFALKGILARAGVSPDGNPLMAVGNTASRFKALRDGRAAAAMLTIPADAVAIRSGLKALATVNGALGSYLGNVVATRHDWANDHRELLVGFLKAYRRSLAWTMNPVNHDAAVAILRREMPELTPDLAELTHARLTDRKNGLFGDMAIDPAALAAVLDLRSRFGPPGAQGDDATGLVDTSFLRLSDHWRSEGPTPTREKADPLIRQ